MDKEYQRIEAYLAAELSEEEAKAFEQELATNPTLKAALEEHTAAHLAAETLAYQHLKKNHQFQNTASRQPRQTARIFSLWKVAAGIIILLGIGLSFWADYAYDKNRLLLNYKEYALSSGQRSVDNRISDDRMTSMQNYMAGAYEDVIARLAPKMSSGPQPDRQEVYLLIYSYIQSGAYDEARQLTDFHLDTGNLADQYNKDWIQLLIALGSDDLDSFHQRLVIILKNPDHPYHADAKTLEQKVGSPIYRWFN